MNMNCTNQLNPERHMDEKHCLNDHRSIICDKCLCDGDPIPKGFRQKILAAAPEIDLNRDGKITAEELKAGRDKLPEDMRAVLDLYLDTQGDTTKESEPAKHKTTLPKPPASNGPHHLLTRSSSIKKIENITYGTAKSGDTTMPLLLDVYRPVATAKLPKKLPAMIFAFGGGWHKGSKDVKYIRDLCGYYAERGYVADFDSISH